MKKSRSTLEQKQKALESEEKRQKQNEELLRKEQAEWKAVNTKRQQQLENDLQSKIKSFADKESEYVQKWDDLKKDKAAVGAEQKEQMANIERLKKESDEEFMKVQLKKTEVQNKEKRLEEGRKSQRLEMDSKIFKHEGEM